MKKKMSRLLALAVTTAVMTFGATGAGATLLGDTVYACGAGGLTGTTLDQAKACVGSNVFTSPSATVGTGVEFTQLFGKWRVILDVGGATGTSDSLLMTFINTGTGTSAALPANAALFLAGLNFGNGLHITDLSLTGADPAVLVNKAGSGFGIYDDTSGPAVLQGDFIMVDLNSANFAGLAAGASYSLTGTITTGVPEPGSLALLGVVLIALALMQIKRVRLFGFRSLGQNLAS